MKIQLNSRYQKIINSFGACLIPDGGPHCTGSQNLMPGKYAENYLSGFDRLTLMLMKFFLLVFEYSAIPLRLRFKTFTKLNSVEQTRFLESWENSRFYFKRSLFSIIKALCCILYYSDETVEQSLGYKPGCEACETEGLEK